MVPASAAFDSEAMAGPGPIKSANLSPEIFAFLCRIPCQTVILVTNNLAPTSFVFGVFHGALT